MLWACDRHCLLDGSRAVLLAPSFGRFKCLKLGRLPEQRWLLAGQASAGGAEDKVQRVPSRQTAGDSGPERPQVQPWGQLQSQAAGDRAVKRDC